ncbi:glucan endo-1,3-beta-glucosidase 14-like [Abrus precatorius]|uniref:glucan endo-1,3-beta-D-glucosidase n=1 Tax=Abrus precatorius TaxID=3816 RepID=A0A8B8KY54_ABRPR|nr:glucan endo-1,3-beta-glucosidase 14-like [Abrus precatorius]
MATFIRRITISYIFVTFFSAVLTSFTDIAIAITDIGFFGRVASFGINYGQVGNNLPPPDRVLELFSNFKITKTRIYDTNPLILNAFANSNVEVTVTIENEILSQLNNPQQALQWVSDHIKPYLPNTKITGIQVGNELYTEGDTTLIQFLVPAVVNIHYALVQLGIDSNIHVSTPSSLAVLEQSYPPSAGSFKSEISGIMYQFLNFLSNTKAPFWINAYPYFAYKNDPNEISLDYVLFNPNEGMVDPNTKLHYDNMLYAQVDAVAFAIARLGFSGIEVRVSETGWPSKGDPDEVGATVQNAQTYNKNLLRRQMANEGTPLSPRMRLEAYLFALFNEDLKTGATSERNYGLFEPDEKMTYNVGLSAFAATSTSSTSISLTSSSTKTKDDVLPYVADAGRIPAKGTPILKSGLDSPCLIVWKDSLSDHVRPTTTAKGGDLTNDRRFEEVYSQPNRDSFEVNIREDEYNAERSHASAESGEPLLDASPLRERPIFAPCSIPGYEWVHGEVAAYFSQF